MKIQAHDLAKHIAPIKPVYVVTGDEPLGVQESLDTIRTAAKKQGYEDRKIMDVSGQFDWTEFTNEWQSMSLFSNKKIIDLRFAKPTVSREGQKALSEFGKNPPEETVLIISLPKVDKQVLQAKWFSTLINAGAVLQIWPPDEAKLPSWIAQRAKLLGLEITKDAAELLADRVSGNLLAATQAMEKLKLSGAIEITANDIDMSTGDSAKFNVFQLFEQCLVGDIQKVSRIFDHLLQEGVEPILILIMLAREVRMLIQLSQSHNLSATFKELRIWDKRQPGYRAALKRINIDELYDIHHQVSALDRALKSGDPLFKTQLRTATLQLAGFNPMPILHI